MMNQLRRRMDRVFDDYEPARSREALRANLADEAERFGGRGRGPRLSLADAGASLTLVAELPGFADKDVQLSIHQDTLTMTGERRVDAPEGYFVHRQERAPIKFARSFTLPCKVDPEKSAATLKDGVLTVTLTKAAEALPKQITVKVQ